MTSHAASPVICLQHNIYLRSGHPERIQHSEYKHRRQRPEQMFICKHRENRLGGCGTFSLTKGNNIFTKHFIAY